MDKISEVGPPVKQWGGKRSGAGRKSKAQKAADALVKREGKTLPTLLDEAQQGYGRALSLLGDVVPELLEGLVQEARLGDTATARFLLSLFLKHANVGGAPKERSPMDRLFDLLGDTIKQSEAHGISRAPLVATPIEAEYRELGDAAPPGPGGDHL